MREIKYRGKRVDNGEWAEGSLLFDYENNEAFIAEYFESKSAYIWEVVPETVGQYTGLEDKNGMAIYEGDTVKAFKYNEIPFSFDITENHGMLWFGNWHWLEFQNDFRNLEVIGNIHDKEDAK